MSDGCTIIDGISVGARFNTGVMEHVNDWLGVVGALQWNEATAAGGTNLVTTTQLTNNNPGVMRQRAVVGAGSRAGVRLDTTAFIMGAVAYTWEAILQYQTWVGEDGESFDGFGDTAQITALTNRIGFHIDQSSGNIFAQTEAASVSTSTDTTVAVAGVGTYIHLQFVATSASVAFLIDGALVTTITTNIPAVGIGAVHLIERGLAGAVNVEKFVDLTHISAVGLNRTP